MTNGIHASPARASALGAANMGGHVATPSSNVANRSVMARTTPAAAASHSPSRTMNSGSMATWGHDGDGAFDVDTLERASAPAANLSFLPAVRRTRRNRARGLARQQIPVRSWSAQGRTTDSGRAPQGFGSSNRPASSPNERNEWHPQLFRESSALRRFGQPQQWRLPSAIPRIVRRRLTMATVRTTRRHITATAVIPRRVRIVRLRDRIVRRHVPTRAPHSSAPSYRWRWRGGYHGGGGGGGYHGGGGGGGARRRRWWRTPLISF